jgi:hypothetical protein
MTTGPRNLSTSAPRIAPDDGSGATSGHEIDDLRQKFHRFRVERRQDEKSLSAVDEVVIEKLEKAVITDARMWPIINYNPDVDTDRQATRRSFVADLKDMGHKFSDPELDALMDGDLRPTEAFRAAMVRVPDEMLQREKSEMAEIVPPVWKPVTYKPNPTWMTYRDVKLEALAVVDGNPSAPMIPLEKRGDATSYWWDEDDDDLQTADVEGWDTFNEDDIMSVAHGKLDELREYRHYARLAAWEMPLLSSEFVWPQKRATATNAVVEIELAKPFEPPTDDQVLRFRYTTYMGEFHPAERKVVVTLSPADLGLTERQQLKMKKLAGPRYDPEKDFIKMSCEKFDHQAQNKRWLVDQVERLIVAAKVRDPIALRAAEGRASSWMVNEPWLTRHRIPPT